VKTPSLQDIVHIHPYVAMQVGIMFSLPICPSYHRMPLY